MKDVSENKAKRGPDQRIKVLPANEGEKAAPRRKERRKLNG
jgi:hypothetical protein